MKHKVKYKERRTVDRRRPVLPYLIFVLLSLSGVFAFAYLFFYDMTRVQEKYAAACGKITLKENSARRRFAEKLFWGNLKEGSFVYSGDLIHTDKASRVKISFGSGNDAIIEENTLIKVVSEGDDIYLELRFGNIQIVPGARNLFAVNIGEALEEAGGDAGAFARAAPQNEKESAAPKAPILSDKVIVSAIESLKNEAPPPPENGEAEIAAVSIMNDTLPSPRIISPANGERITGEYIEENGASILFRWSPVRGANAYLWSFKPAENLYPRILNDNYITFDNLASLSNTKYIWQVQALYIERDGSVSRRSAVAEGTFVFAIPKPRAPDMKKAEVQDAAH